MELEDFNRWLAERNMGGMWNMDRTTAEEVKPCIWKWDDVRTALTTAGELVPIEQVAMRTVQLKNPGLNTRRMSNTLHFSVQCLMPGERTKAHRNLVSETRFVLQAPQGGEFIVDGESFPMQSGDVVTTPNWSWHDHHNGGNEPAIWLDGMDTRLVGIGKGMNERFVTEQQPIERPEGYSNGLVGFAKPSWVEWDRPTPPPHRYHWADTYSALMALREQEVEGDPCDGLQVLFSNPLTGGPTLPTYACEIQLFNPRQKAQTHRHNSTTVYNVYRGQGVTTIEGERFEWSQGDILIVPPWAWHSHENLADQDAILYSIGDWPAMQALALYREERQD